MWGLGRVTGRLWSRTDGWAARQAMWLLGSGTVWYDCWDPGSQSRSPSCDLRNHLALSTTKSTTATCSLLLVHFFITTVPVTFLVPSTPCWQLLMGLFCFVSKLTYTQRRIGSCQMVHGEKMFLSSGPGGSFGSTYSVKKGLPLS